MTNQEVRQLKTQGCAEANLYIEKARWYLKKAERGDCFYGNTKYSSLAAGTAYQAVIVVLDTWLKLKRFENSAVG